MSKEMKGRIEVTDDREPVYKIEAPKNMPSKLAVILFPIEITTFKEGRENAYKTKNEFGNPKRYTIEGDQVNQFFEYLKTDSTPYSVDKACELTGTLVSRDEFDSVLFPKRKENYMRKMNTETPIEITTPKGNKVLSRQPGVEPYHIFYKI